MDEDLRRRLDAADERQQRAIEDIERAVEAILAPTRPRDSDPGTKH